MNRSRTQSNSAATPPFARLADALRRRLREESPAPGALLGTETEIAREGGVSRMTARRAVQALIDEGLVERRAGRGVFVRGEGSATRVIRFLAGNLLWAPAVRVAQAVQEDAPDAGLDVSIFDARGDLAALLDELRALPESGTAGAIVMSQHDPAFNRALAALVAANYPFVVVDQALADLPAPSVAADNRAGGRLAAEALLAAGHRRFAFLGDLAADTTAARAQGVADACAAALVPPPAVFDIPGQRFADWEPAIRERVAELLRMRMRPTALACSCDAVALHAIRALVDAGLAVPRDMSVTGFDDDPIAEWSSPALTTVRQDFSEMGRRALAALAAELGKATGKTSEPPDGDDLHIAVPVALVERASIASPRRRRPAALAVFHENSIAIGSHPAQSTASAIHPYKHANTMKPHALLTLTSLALLSAGLCPVHADTGWLQTTAGTYTFTDIENWQDGIVSGLFGDNLSSKVTLNLTFDQDWTFGENGLSFEHPGEVTFILRGDGTDRTATFASDMAWAPPATKGSLTFGSATAGQNLDIDLGGGTRTLSSTFPASFYNTLSNGDLVLEGTANPFGFYGASALAGTGTITLRKSAGNTAMPILRIGEESGSDAGRRIASTLRLEAGTVQFYARKYGSGAEDSFGTVQLASAPKTAPSDYQGGYPVFSFRSSNKPLTVRIGTFERVHDTLLDITANNTALLGSATEVNAVRLLVDNGVETVGGSAGTTSCAIVPWARIAETGFAVYDAANGFRALSADTERRTISEAFEGELETEGENVYIAPGISKVEFTGQRTVVNSLATGYANVAQEVVATNGTLVVTSGAIMLDSNQRVYLRANLDFGGRRGYFTNRPGKYSELHGSVAGSSGITFGSIPLGNPQVPATYPGQGSLSVYSTGTFTGDVSIVGNVWLQSDSFLPSGNRTGDTIVDGNLRIGNAPAFMMNGLRGRGTITLNNSYTASIVVGDNDADADFEGNINRTGGTLSFRKIGEGTQRIGGSVAINGTLAVEKGTLLLDGDVTGTSPSVAAGAALGGAGLITGNITFAEGSSLAVAAADGTVPCLTVNGAVTGSAGVVVSGELRDGTEARILRSESPIAATFTATSSGIRLETRAEGKELWVVKPESATVIVFR